jgi:hypothetical protein
MLNWLRYSYQLVLAVGFGTLLSANLGNTNANASVASDQLGGSVILKQENGSLLISEGGRPFEPLDLGDTPEATELRTLFRRLSPDGSAVRIPVDRRIVADGGVGVSKSPPPETKRKQSSGKQ